MQGFDTAVQQSGCDLVTYMEQHHYCMAQQAPARHMLP